MLVLDKLISDVDRKSWRLVCKEFLQIEFLPGLLRRYCNIETLDLSVCPRIDDGGRGGDSGKSPAEAAAMARQLAVGRVVMLSWRKKKRRSMVVVGGI